MTPQPYHHGTLRAELLERAETLLRTDGADALSLREVARQAGVSHGAPRAHFIDRQSLLDALAVRGFERLTAEVGSALHGGRSFKERFQRVARSYVLFAVEDGALMELMFTIKNDDPDGSVHAAAVRLFQILDEVLGEETPATSQPAIDARDRFKLLFAATMQGVATLIAAQRVTPEQGNQLVEDAVEELLASTLATRAELHPGS